MLCQDIDNHPAFMKEWDPSKPMTPELEALISLKYEQCEDDIGRSYSMNSFITIDTNSMHAYANKIDNIIDRDR